MRVFPIGFDFLPGDWRGERANQFVNKRADAFQQLVGDALREAIPGAVEVMHTEGNDGSIDAFIPDGAMLPPLLSDVSTPIIVECKDNDDRKDKFTDNILSAWRNVAKRLARKAAEGWPGLFAPWADAHGYVFATSAILPHKEARNRLVAEISSFFQGLRAKGRSKIVSVRVVDWSDLRNFLGGYPRITDAWLGTALPDLITHAQRKKRLVGIRRHLVDLPFVTPDRAALAHPDRIFSELAAHVNSGGILIVGPGGIGKTRTLVEVSSIAERAGWRVLHVVDQRKVTCESMASELLGPASKTLIVIDYLEQATGLDFDAVRSQLLPAAAERSIEVVFLAAARPGIDVQRSGFFHVIELTRDAAQADEVIDVMLNNVAPIATERLGRERIKKIAGNRPIIALFIMREIERIAQVADVSTLLRYVPSDRELMDWLRKCLDQDGLMIQRSTTPWSQEQVEPFLVAAAAMLCAAPQNHDELCALAAKLLSASGGGQSVKTKSHATHIVSVLVNIGWLEEREDFLFLAHDVVADEVLGRALFETRSGALRDEVLASTMNAAVESPRVFARLVISLDRLLGDGRRAAALLSFASQWLGEVAVNFSDALCTADFETSDVVVFTMAHSAMWAPALTKHFSLAVKPWLQLISARHNAPVSLFGLLTLSLVKEHRAILCTAALSWCREHPGTEAAANLLRVLLMDFDATPSDAAREMVSMASTWIEHQQESPEAYLLTGVLLSRPELDPHTVRALINNAESVLDAYLKDDSPRNAGVQKLLAQGPELVNRREVEVLLLLRPLLAQRDLSERVVTKCVAASILWLEKHPSSNMGSQILAPLLRHTDLAHAWDSVIKLTKAWLSRHSGSQYAGDVLGVVFERIDVQAEMEPESTRIAVAWLEKHGRSKVSWHLLAVVLRRSDLPSNLKEPARKIAEEWLEGPTISDPLALPVLRALLEQQEQSVASATLVKNSAEAWLLANSTSPTACFVIAALLDRKDIERQTKLRYVDAALDWLAESITVSHVPILLRAILLDVDIEAPARTRAQELVLRWVEAREHQEDAGYALHFLLQQFRQFGGIRTDVDRTLRVINGTIGWLRANPSSELVSALLTEFFFGPCFPPRCIVYIAEMAFVWLVREENRVTREIITQALLYCIRELPDDDQATVKMACEQALETLTDRVRGEICLASLGFR